MSKAEASKNNLAIVVRMISERLADSLLPSDLRHGWTETRKGEAAALFLSIGAMLAEGKSLAAEDLDRAEAVIRSLPDTGQLASDVAYGVEALRLFITPPSTGR